MLSVSLFIVFISEMRARGSLTNGLVAYWPMNTVAGSVTPDVVSGYDMTLQNMTETNLVAGRLGASNCFSFYTAQQTLLRYVANPGDALPINKNPSFTLNIWVNVNASTGAVADTRVFGEQHFSGTNNNPL